MTREAVNKTLANVVTIQSFRNRLFSGQVKLEELLRDPVLAGLDEQDAAAVLKGAEKKSMKSLGSYLNGYTAGRYGLTPGQLEALRK